MIEKSKNEIDLFEVIKILWYGKFQIIFIIFLALTVGIFLSSRKPESFKISIPLQSADSSIFTIHTSLNDILQENNRSLKIDSESIFGLLERELTNRKVIIDIIKDNKFIKQQINDLDALSANKALIGYANLFKLTITPKDEILLGGRIQRSFSLVWHDTDEGLNIMKNILITSLENVKRSIINDVSQLANSLEYKNERELEELNLQLSALEQSEAERIERYIIYLNEQAEIAKVLGIETNSLNASALSQSESNSFMITNGSENFNNNFDTSPFFLRGYKAIYKEIELLKNRSKEQQMLMSNSYLSLKKKIRLLEASPASSQLLRSLNTFDKSKSINLAEFDIGLTSIVSQKQTIITLLYSLIIGMIIAIIYTLIFYAIRNREENM